MKNIDKQTRITMAQDFLNQLFENVPAEKFGYLWTKQDKKTYPFALPDSLAQMARKAIELNEAGFDVYYGVNLMDAPPAAFKRVTADLVSLQTATVTDIDIFSEAHKDENLAANFDEAKSFLPFTPSIVINSGYGLQALYLYSPLITITNRAECEARNKKLLDVIRSKAAGKKIDGVGDLPRVLRVPGTYNYKLGRDKAPLCHIVEVNNIRFNTAAIDAKLNDLTPLTHKQKQRYNTENLSDCERAKNMLAVIPVADLSYDDWLHVGMALKNNGNSCADWEQWSRQDERFKDEECEKKWQGFNRDGLTIATIHGIAKRYQEPARNANFETVEEKISTPSTTTFNGYDFLHDTNYDLDNARRLVKYRGDSFRWLVDDESWILYSDGIWLRRSEKNSCLYPFAEQFADEMGNFAKILADKFQTLTAPTVIHKNFADKNPEEKIYDKAKADKDKAFKVADYFKQRKNYSAAIDLMKGCNSILITAEDLNKHKNLLACQNGVIDLETGKLFDFAPELLITNQVAALYDSQVDTSFVEKFFAEVLPDDDTCRAVLRYLGYCLTGEKNFHISQFWRGSGANGKSTILDALIRLLASYAVKLPCAALLESNMPINANGATPALALLDGDIRLALVDELPRNSRLNAALYKTITGDETVAARPLYGNFRNIQLRAKLILNGNHLPTFDVDDVGLQRRINNVAFTQKFEGDRADSKLPKKLATPQNRSALLKLLVDEATQYYQHGLLESDAMKEAKAAYFAESDFISDFVDDFCDIGDGFILRKEFIDRLKAEHCADTRRFSSQELFKAVCSSLARNGVVYTKDRLKNNIFKGIRWQGEKANMQDDTDFSGKIISSKDYAMP